MMAGSKLKLGEFAYDPEQNALSDSLGEECKLRPQSLAVLHLLASQPNKVIPKDEIFNVVWPDVTVTDDSLVQCIADIRRTLGDQKHQILQTVPRRGYKLVSSTPLANEKTGAAHGADVSKMRFTRWPAFSGLIALLSIAMIAGVSWFVNRDDADSVTAAENLPPSLFLDVFSGATSAQAKRVETETKVALGRYRTIRLINAENADYQLSLEIDDEQVTAELIDTSDEAVIFLDSFPLAEDQPSANNAGIRIAAAIASPGGGAIGRRLLAQSRNKPVAELTRQECYSHAYNCPTCSGEEDTLTHRSNACIADILAEDPEDALAWALQATILTRQLWFGVSLSAKQRNDPELLKQLPAKALAAANRAEALSNGDNSGVYWGMAQAYVASCELDKLKVAINRGLEINPNDPNLLAPFGNWLAFTGSWEEGSALSRRALEIEPRKYKPWWWQGIAKTHFQRKEYAQSLEAFLKSYNERSWLSRLQLAYTLPYVGRVEDAQKEVQQLLEMLPDFNREAAWAFYEKFCFPAEYIQRMDRGVALAGLPAAKSQKMEEESSSAISVLPNGGK